MDRYNEHLVKGKPGTVGYVLVVISTLLILIGLYLTITIPFGILVLIIGIACEYYAVGGLSIEYEYIITNGDIDISKIISMKKRKAVKEIKCGDIVCMDKADSPKVKNDIDVKNNLVVCDYSPQIPGNQYYAIYTNEKGKKTINIFDFDDKCIEHMKLYLKTKSLV